MKFEKGRPSHGDGGAKKEFKKKRVSIGLGLNKFSSAKVSNYDRREVLEKQREERGIGQTPMMACLDNVFADGLDERCLPRGQENASGEPSTSKPQQPGRYQPGGNSEGASNQPSRQRARGTARGSVANNFSASNKHQEAEVKTGKLAGSEQQHAEGKTSKPADAQGEGDRQAASEQQEADGKTVRGKFKKVPKPLSQVQRLASKIQAEKDSANLARGEVLKSKEAMQSKIKAAETARKKDKSKFFKKTRSGQPVMKYRMEKLLEQIQ
eukprot:gene28120-31234_t